MRAWARGVTPRETEGIMRNLGYAATLIAMMAFATAALAQTAPAPSLDRVHVEAFMSGAARQAMRDDRIVGISVAVIDPSGVLMARGYGHAGADRDVDADTLFRIGSISKTFTWIAIMQLVEAGTLTLDDPINDHLPEALRIPDDGFSEPILVRYLLTHSAGFEDSALGHLFVNRPEAVTTLSAYLARYRVRRVRPPGTLSVYSNYGAALAGAIVEHESGQDWATYAEAHILRPLGMASSTFREGYSPEIASANALSAPAPAEVLARITEGFRMEQGQMQAAGFEYIMQIAPAGGMSASANDMALYMQALLNPARLAAAGVLSEATARQLREPIFANDERLGSWRHGFMTFDLGGGRWAYGHGGDTIYQHSEMLVSPDLGFGLFVTVNTTATFSRAPASLAEAFIAEFYPPPAPTRAEVTMAESARFAGTYRNLRRAFHRTEAGLYRIFGAIEVAPADNGDLIVAGGLTPQRLIPLGDGVYQSADGVNRIAFREVDGTMRMFDPFGLAPSDRIGFLESANWLNLILGLGFLVAVWGVFAGVRRAFMRKETLGALAFDGLCLVWLVALSTTIIAMSPWLAPDQGVVLFGYPGRLFPIACWMLAAAAAATALAVLLALTFARPKDWGWLRWTRAGAAVAVFAALTFTLWDWNMLGFSGF
jgi:CubicO group peptidase (beta-lactamase class C family)